ncbi:tRNA epoxyqueuosine(34) reductase QueG [Glaciecola siphonariae]|uniref:Epoxyqueuosine reductase n=1 Tax=Glaciecola siphonariae TaxID=521012 RepID=A0ABV9LZ06_9ALTE
MQSTDYQQLANHIKAWGKSLGFQQVGIADVDLSKHHSALLDWISKGYHGQMSFFERNIEKRMDPQALVPGTLRIISVRMDYLPEDAKFANTLEQSDKAYISRYALGRDYHKIIRKRLKQLAEKIQQHCAELAYRPFVDSAPVLEHAIAEKAGIGWTGKHSLTLNEHAGSWFFLGELFVNIPLPVDNPAKENCGTCQACISICPTKAIVAPYKVDARRCISYLTIEHEGVIPTEFRQAMGNRIYGCDDCQLVCPFNREASISDEKDFARREVFEDVSLLSLFSWTESDFLKHTEGSAIRRIGYAKWQRNLSIALGNASYSPDILVALNDALAVNDDPCLTEHFSWAIDQQLAKQVQWQKHRKDEHAIELNELGITRQQARLVRLVKKGLPRDA